MNAKDPADADSYFVDCLRLYLGMDPLYPERWIDWRRVPWGQFNDHELSELLGVIPDTVRGHRRALGIAPCYRTRASGSRKECALTTRSL